MIFTSLVTFLQFHRFSMHGKVVRHRQMTCRTGGSVTKPRIPKGLLDCRDSFPIRPLDAGVRIVCEENVSLPGTR